MKEIRIKEKEITGWLGDTYKETYFNLIDIFVECFKNMSGEQKLLLLKELAMEKEVSEQVVKRIILDDLNWELSEDNDYRLKILEEINRKTIETLDWKLMAKLLRDVDSKLNELKNHKELYWKMYHDDVHGDFFRKWLKENKIESDYQKEEKELKKYVKNKIDEFFLSKNK